MRPQTRKDSGGAHDTERKGKRREGVGGREGGREDGAKEGGRERGRENTSSKCI